MGRRLANGFCCDRRIGQNAATLAIQIQLQNSTLRGVIKRLRFPLEMTLLCVRWHATYPLSLRNVEEMMAVRGMLVDHTTAHR